MQSDPSPKNVGMIRFSGFSPEPSLGIAVLTSDNRLLLTESSINQGTSLTNAIESAIATARQTYGLTEGAPIYQWTPKELGLEESVWEVRLDEGGRASWAEVDDLDADAPLAAAVRAARDAA